MNCFDVMLIAGSTNRIRHMKEPPLSLNWIVLRQTMSPLEACFENSARWFYNDTGRADFGRSLGRGRASAWSFLMQRETPIAA